ncbi:hypothetical protein RCJ22_34155, partial [Vibrio sp. FNV 38]|nr:hypothetical protein [Vibrio sp. FNV 38]
MLAVAMQADRLRRDRCPFAGDTFDSAVLHISSVAPAPVLRFQSTRLTGFAAPASRQPDNRDRQTLPRALSDHIA